MKYNTVLFDLDGTLLDSREEIFAAVNETLLRGFGRRYISYEVFVETCHAPYDAFWKAHGVTATYAEIFAYYSTYLRIDRCALFDDVIQELSILRDLGCTIGVITAQDEKTVDRVVVQTGLSKFVDSCHAGHESKSDIIAKYSRHNSTVYVGDAISDVECGKKGGATTVSISRNCPTLRNVLLRAHADHHIEHLFELTEICQGKKAVA